MSFCLSRVVVVGGSLQGARLLPAAGVHTSNIAYNKMGKVGTLLLLPLLLLLLAARPQAGVEQHHKQRDHPHHERPQEAERLDGPHDAHTGTEVPGAGQEPRDEGEDREADIRRTPITRCLS